MASLQNVSLEALLTEISNRATNLIIRGSITEDDDELELGIIKGNPAENIFNLELLKMEILNQSMQNTYVLDDEEQQDTEEDIEAYAEDSEVSTEDDEED